MSILKAIPLAPASLFAMAIAVAADYTEKVDGDLNDITHPTKIVLSPGSNIISGRVGANDPIDAFNLDLHGLTLLRIDVLAIDIGSGSSVRFSNCRATASDCPFTSNEAVGLDLQQDDLGQDLMMKFILAGAYDDPTPLFELSEHEGPTRYELNFVTAAMPDVSLPKSAPLLMASMASFCGLGWCRKSKA